LVNEDSGTSEGGGGGGGITPTKVNNVSESVSVLCVESWTCGNWEKCINGTQTRECIDKNYCGTTEKKPQNERECEQEEEEKETGAVPLTGAIIREIRENISWIGTVLIVLFILMIAFKIRGIKIKKNRKGWHGKI
jgi:hypothetical protein